LGGTVTRISSKLLAILALVAWNPVTVKSQENGWTWADAAELSFVWTAGNASTNTLGLKNVLTGAAGKSKVSFEVGGIRTQSSMKNRIANGTTANFTVTETSESELTAASYFAKSRYDLSINGSAYWFAGSDWNRNTFSGINNRLTFVSGLGNQFVDTDEFKFRTDLGATYTIQDNVAAGPTDRFGGVRFTYDLERAVTANSKVTSKLVLDENLANTDDLRGDWTNALTVAMNSRLALKTSAQLLFDNQPSFVDVPLLEGGVDLGNTVAAELDKVDSVFTVALVMNF